MITLFGGRWAAVKVRLGGGQVPQAIASLKGAVDQIDTSLVGEPAFRLVVTRTGPTPVAEDGMAPSPAPSPSVRRAEAQQAASQRSAWSPRVPPQPSGQRPAPAGNARPAATTSLGPGYQSGTDRYIYDGNEPTTHREVPTMPKPIRVSELDLSREHLASLMDFSVLNPDAGKVDIDRGIAISKEYGFKGFHTNPDWAPYVADQLEGTGIEAGWVVAFPFGCLPTGLKVAEAREGARVLGGRPWVIDMVANHGKLKSGDYDYYRRDIAEVVKAAHDGGAECKAILEAQLLTDEELKTAVTLACEAGVDWVKSSTGRHGGPQLAQVKIMCETAAEGVKVKVAGTGSFWTPMVTLGCLLLGVERIGTRNAPWICDELAGEIAPLLK